MTEKREITTFTQPGYDNPNAVEMIRYENGAVAFKEGGQYGNWIYFYPEQIAAVAAFITEKTDGK